MWGEIPIGMKPIPLRCNHGNLNIDGMKKPETFDELLLQKKLLEEAVERYFEWTSVFSELKEGDQTIADIRTNTKTLCLSCNSKKQIKTFETMYWEDVVKLALEHYEESGAWDVALLRWAVEMELDAEEAEMRSRDTALFTQIKAWKDKVSKTM